MKAVEPAEEAASRTVRQDDFAAFLTPVGAEAVEGSGVCIALVLILASH